jgi:hypothetical protein
MKTSSRLNLPFWLIKAGLATILAVAMLMLSAQTSLAQHGSATWTGLSPNNEWSTALNWTQGGPPNGPSDTATFANSNSLFPDAYFIEVNGIIFTSGASAYTIYARPLTISGVGITNLSGITQTFSGDGGLIFTNSASAGSRTAFNASQVFFHNNSTAAYGTFSTGVYFTDSSSADNATFPGAVPSFYDSSFAGNATFNNFSNGAYFYGNSSAGSATFSCSCCCEVRFLESSTASNAIFTNASASFSESSTAANGRFLNAGGTSGSSMAFGNFSSAGSAMITNDGGTVGGAGGGGAGFLDSSTADNATIINNGGTVSGAYGGQTSFGGTSTAGNATLIANGGTGGGEGGFISFGDASTGGTSRVKVFGNGYLQIGNDQGSVIIGSIEGTGNVFLPGPGSLTVGSNNLSTTFSGAIQGGGGTGGSLAKIGSGILTFQGRATHNYVASTVGLSLVSGSIIKLNFTGTPDTIRSLIVNGVPQIPGLYGGPASGAPHQLPEFASAGTVQVTMLATPTPTPTPAVTTNPATNVASLSATLNGSLYPYGLATTVYFQYGTTTNYGFTTPVQTQTGNTYLNISANISGLSANTAYHFRIVAHNSAGTSFGSDRTFTTLSATGPPVVTTNPATLIASFSTTLNGSLDPHGFSTNVYFEYGTTTDYGLTTAMQTQTGNMYRNVSANISSLRANTVYHYRIVATNNAGTVHGADRTFTTLSTTGPPVVTTNPATNVTTFSATLNGSLDPHGLITTVSFRWGTTTSYGHTTPMQSRTGNTYRNITANISGLTTHTTYHFRIIATNTAGTRNGGDRTFTTP